MCVYIYICIYIYIYIYICVCVCVYVCICICMYIYQWRSNVPKSGGAHRHVIFVPSVKNQYRRVVFGCMVI